MKQWQKRPPGYELFFAPLQVEFDPTTYERVQFAYLTSKYGHRGVEREDGTRYFDHPKAAAWIYISEFEGRDAEIIINLLLHDLREDTYLLSLYRIALNFGKDRAKDIRALTKLPKDKETTQEYLGRIVARGPRAIFTKLADRLHNLRTMSACSEEKRATQIEETRIYHIPLLITALKEAGGIWAEHAVLMEEKIEEAIAFYAT